MAAGLAPHLSPFPGLQMEDLLLCPHVVRKEESCLFHFYKGANPTMRPHPQDLMVTKLSPKGPTAKYYHIKD